MGPNVQMKTFVPQYRGDVVSSSSVQSLIFYHPLAVLFPSFDLPAFFWL